MRFSRRFVLVSSLVLGCAGTQPPPPDGPQVEVLRPLRLTEAARIPQNDPAFASVDIFRDRLVFHYTRAPAEPLAVGHVVAGNTGTGYLRRITAVTQADPTRVEVATAPAELTDLILDGAFRVRHTPSASAWKDGDVRRRYDPVESKLGILPPGSKTGFQCGATGAGTVEVEPSFETDLSFELAFDIEAQLVPPKGRLVSALVALQGQVIVGLDVKANTAFSGQCTQDIIAYLRQRAGNDDLYKKELPDIRFAVGPVPICRHRLG